MLAHRLLKNHAGILLIGDYTSLAWLNEAVHDINTRSPLVTDKEGAFLGLAFDARKAYERQREIIRPPAHLKEIGVRYGVKILWPVILLQARLLRLALAFVDHSREHQAITYALEAVIEKGLREDFPGSADAIIARWQRIDAAQPNVFAKLDSRGAIFSSWTKSQRQKLMLPLLESFDPLFDTLYEFDVRHGQRTATLSPAEIVRWENTQWPDPKW